MRNFCYAVLGVILLLAGCNISDLDFTNLKIEDAKTDIAFPIGTANYTMRELLDDIADSQLTIEEDPITAELRLLYYQSASYTFTPQILDIQNITGTSTLNMANLTGPAPMNQSIPFNHEYVPVKNEIVEQLFHGSQSSINIQVSSTSNVSFNYTLELSGVTHATSGVAASVPSTLLVAGMTNNHTISLANHKSLFTTVAGKNQLAAKLDIVGTVLAGQSLNSDVIFVTLTFSDPSFVVAFGKFGKDTVDISGGTIDMDLFENFGVSGLEFGNPSIKFDFENSFGVPIGLGVGRIFGEQTDGSRRYLSGSSVTTPLVITTAVVQPPTIGIPVQSTITIDSKNSSLRTLLASTPTKLGFDLRGFTNPYSTTALNFVTPTSTVTGDIEVTIPLEVLMSDVEHEIEFDIAGASNLTKVDSVVLRLVTTNELPFQAEMDMYIMNGTDTLYRILEKKAIAQPFLNFDRTVREPKISVSDLPLGKSGVEALNNGDKIKVVFTMNSPQSVTSQDIYVKLLATAKLQVSLGARAIINADL